MGESDDDEDWWYQPQMMPTGHRDPGSIERLNLSAKYVGRSRRARNRKARLRKGNVTNVEDGVGEGATGSSSGLASNQEPPASGCLEAQHVTMIQPASQSINRLAVFRRKLMAHSIRWIGALGLTRAQKRNLLNNAFFLKLAALRCWFGTMVNQAGDDVTSCYDASVHYKFARKIVHAWRWKTRWMRAHRVVKSRPPLHNLNDERFDGAEDMPPT